MLEAGVCEQVEASEAERPQRSQAEALSLEPQRGAALHGSQDDEQDQGRDCVTDRGEVERIHRAERRLADHELRAPRESSDRGERRTECLLAHPAPPGDTSIVIEGINADVAPFISMVIE